MPLSNSDKSLFYTTADWIDECNAKGSKRGKKKKSCKLAGEGTGQSYLVRGEWEGRADSHLLELQLQGPGLLQVIEKQILKLKLGKMLHSI